MKKGFTLVYRISLGVVLLLLVGFSALPMIPPKTVSADAPATRFSAQRAMADLQRVAAQPHGAGSQAQASVREYIVSQVAALGLAAEVQPSGSVSNILVSLPGSNPTRTVLVTGHYDSHPPAPGAGDDGISAVAMLESIRVLHASDPLRNNVLFLFTDGEELGWLGAGAFLADNRDVKQEIGVVLVFDARPGNAPLTLLETSPGDGWLVKNMVGLPVSLWAGSWNNRQERKEKDTDFDIFQPAGFTGAAFENEASGTRYHTNRDSIDAISSDLVQAYGQSMLVLTRRFASISIPADTRAPDLVFFILPLLGIVAHPTWLVPALGALSLLALLIFIVISWRRAAFSPGRFLLSLLGLLPGILLIVFGAHTIWGQVLKSHKAEIARYAGFEASAAWQAGLMIGAACLMILLLALLARFLGGVNLAVASAIVYLLVWYVAYLSMDADNPLTTAYIVWPFVGGVAGMWIFLLVKNPVWKVVSLSLAALVMLLLAVPYLWLGTYTREDAWIPVLATCIPVALFAPQVDAIFGRSK